MGMGPGPQRWRLRDLLGLLRSIAIYHGKPGQTARLRSMYGRLVPPGGLCFDIGAHVGNRTRCFRGLGARVIALEPQPRFAVFLQWLFRRDPEVTVLPLAVGATVGQLELRISSLTPTVSTGSAPFRSAVAGIASFRGVAWDERVEVDCTTLDRLIEAYGLPDFVKIDVEGMEDEVLLGLSQAVPCLSFELLPAHKAAASRAAARLQALGSYRFNVSLGETMALIWPQWVEAAELEGWIGRLAPHEPSGDIYASLKPIT